MTRWVVDLDDEAATDPRLAGGKAANLARLIGAGLPVPPAIVVTTDAFRAHFPAACPDHRPEPPALQTRLQEAVGACLDRTFPSDVQLAVRSSARGEDHAHWSFAGQHETYYYIRPADVASAIRDCWLSLWSNAARRYRAEQGVAQDDFAMAVIVQQMVPADRSGVCFTADPTGRDPAHACIEAIWGLGAALVDGRVSPDRLLVHRSGRILRRHIGRKRHQVAAASPPGAARLEPLPLSRQTAPVLSEDEAREVLNRSLEAEHLFGAPQDVEWAYRDGALWLLQSRPITTVGEEAAPETAEIRGRWVLFKPLAENFTEPLTPLSADLLGRVLPPGGRCIDGRYYLNLDTAERLCPLRWSTDELVDVLLLRGDVPELNWNWRKAPLAVLALASAYLLDGIAWHRTAHLTRHSLEEYPELCHRLRSARSTDALASLQRLVFGRHALEPIGRVAFYVNISAGRYFLVLGALTKLVDRFAPDFERALLGHLCSGDGDTWSRRLVEGVRRLAETAREDAGLTRQIVQADARELTERLAALGSEHPFAMALAAFLGSFGHRCLREMELAVPRWRDDPLPVLLMVRAHLRSPAPDPQDPHAQHLAARDALRRALPRRWQKHLADHLIRRLRYYTSLREDTRHYHSMAMDVVRGKLLDLEQQLLADGRLRLAGDVFYLSWDEIGALRSRRLGWKELASRVRRRRRRELQLSRAGARETINVQTAAPADACTSDGRRARARVLLGHCASPGTAEGRVRIVLDPTTVDDLQPGDVLVAPYTDPAWTPLFPLAAAIVVEVGSYLSHAGTVAREYGVPCLVDVADCTRRLEEGSRVRVLATDGLIEVLEP